LVGGGGKKKAGNFRVKKESVDQVRFKIRKEGVKKGCLLGGTQKSNQKRGRPAQRELEGDLRKTEQGEEEEHTGDIKEKNMITEKKSQTQKTKNSSRKSS